MSLLSLDLSPMMLAAQVVKVYGLAHGLAYAHIAPDLTVVQASPNFSVLLTEPTTVIEGQPLTTLMPVFVGAEATLRAILQGDKIEHKIERVHHRPPDSQVAYLTFWVTAIDPESPGAGLLLIIEDVTEASQLDLKLLQERNELRLIRRQLDRLNQFKSLLLSMTAHDLRNSLGLIRAYAELLLMNPQLADLDKPKEYATTIITQIDQLFLFITNLLDLDRVEQDQLKINPDNCLVEALLGNVLGMARLVAEQAHLRIVTELPPEPLLIWADPDRMQQILHNLIGNALKYTPAGGTVRIGAWAEATEAVIQISDTGPGMTDAEQADLFQAYYRTGEATKSNIKGTGLGLFIVKTLLDAQNGHIEVASQPGQGTTFTIRMPLVNSQA